MNTRTRNHTLSAALLSGLALAAGGCAGNDQSQSSWRNNEARQNTDYEAADYSTPAYSTPTEFSGNRQINRGNVMNLQQVSTLALGDCSALQGRPMVSNGRLVVNTAANSYAFDAQTGRQLTAEPYKGLVATGPNGPIPPVTTAGGLTFAADANGNLVAKDSATGESLYTYSFTGPITGVETYTVSGWQYIAVTSAAKDGNCSVAVLSLPKNPITLAIDEHK